MPDLLNGLGSIATNLEQLKKAALHNISPRNEREYNAFQEGTVNGISLALEMLRGER